MTNPNTASPPNLGDNNGDLILKPVSPVTRNAEVEEAIAWLDARDTGNETVAGRIMAYIAQLEASQPKPFEQQGRDKNGQYAHKGVPCKCGHTLGEHGAEPPHDFCTHKEEHTGETCDCDEFQPKPQSDEGLRKSIHKNEVSTLRRANSEISSSIDRLEAALSQAPVPTSAAEEIAKRISTEAYQHGKFYKHKVAAIIQQYGDARCVEGRRDQEQFHLEEKATQPPAADRKPPIKSPDEWAQEILHALENDSDCIASFGNKDACTVSAIVEKAVLNGRWELRHAPNVTSSRWADQVVRCLKQMFPNWEKGYDWKNSRSENDKFVFDPQCANEAIDAIRKYEDYLIKGDFGFVADRSAMRSAAFEEGRKSALADGKLREALLEKWHKLPEPRCRKIDGEGPNAAKHNAKVAADLEDGKTYLMYDHHRSAFWGPNNSGYQFRKGAGFYDKAAALKVLAGSSRYFTAEEVPADILAALAQPASGGGD